MITVASIVCIVQSIESYTPVTATSQPITNITDCGLQITFSYTVDNKTYTVTEMKTFLSNRDLGDFVNDYSNTTITVYYKDDPSKATTDPTQDTDWLYTIAFLSTIALCILCVMGCIGIWCERNIVETDRVPSFQEVV